MSRKHRGRAKGDPVTYQTPLPAGGVQLETFLPWTLVRRGLKKQVITPLDAPQEFLEEARRERLVREAAQDTPLMRALGLAYHWQRLLDEGRFTSITEIAQRLLVCGRRDLPRLGQMRQKSFYFMRAHLARVAQAVKTHESPHPVDVSLLCRQSEVPIARG